MLDKFIKILNKVCTRMFTRIHTKKNPGQDHSRRGYILLQPVISQASPQAALTVSAGTYPKYFPAIRI